MDYKQAVRAYYVLSKPGIIYANILTAAAGYFFAARLNITWLTLLGLLSGLTLVIAGACATNNCLDRGIDANMVRTKKRALVQGLISPRAALIYASAATISGLIILYASQNWLTTVLAATAWFDYVVLYGYAKRKSVHGTLVGCVSGAIPLVAGYTAVSDKITTTAWLLFGLMVAWQMAHFYGIALYRLKDYQAAHIPVMPAVHGTGSTQWQALGYIVAFISITAVLVGTGTMSVWTGSVLLIISGLWLYRAARSYRQLSSEIWGRQVFMFSLLVMLGMSLALFADPLLA